MCISCIIMHYTLNKYYLISKRIVKENNYHSNVFNKITIMHSKARYAHQYYLIIRYYSYLFDVHVVLLNVIIFFKWFKHFIPAFFTRA